MGNSEVIFSIQFTLDPIYNGDGNKSHLYWGSWYEDQPGMMRDIANGRPYRFHRATNKTMFELFDRKNDSRFYKSFKWTYYCNNLKAPPLPPPPFLGASVGGNITVVSKELTKNLFTVWPPCSGQRGHLYQ